MKKYETIAVIVTYNRKELLKESVQALLNLNNSQLGILIVDNYSTDGTKEYIKDCIKLPNIEYINTGSNLGGAGGFNFGIKEAYKHTKKYIWIMDDDCIVEKDSLNSLLEFAKNKKDCFGFLASKVLWKDGNISKMNLQRKTVFLPVKNPDETQKVTLSSFVSLFIKKEVIEEVGLPIKDFFIWTDDLEYSGRISKVFSCYLVSTSVVIHKSKENLAPNIVRESGERMKWYKYAYRNEYYLYRREGLKGYCYYYLRNIYNIISILLFSKDRKTERIKIVLNGARDGRKFNPQIEYIKEVK